MKRLVIGSVPLVGLVLLACGSDSGSEFDPNNPNNKPPAQLMDAGFGGGSPGTNPACATALAPAKLNSVNLVLMYDKSGSMGDKMRKFSCPVGGVTCTTWKFTDGTEKYVCSRDASTTAWNGTGFTMNGNLCATGTVAGEAAFLCDDPNACGTPTAYFDPAQKWVPVGQAMTAFFADPVSAGLNASLTFFPATAVTVSGVQEFCAASDYTTPSVAITSLPNATAFQAAINGTKPFGNTPTEAALKGAVQYAKTVEGSHPGESVVIVLVTDGMPTQCPGSSPQDISVASAVATGASTDPNGPIKTYVIGIGDSLTNLDTLAAAGGTGKATIISTSSPSVTSTGFRQALESIRSVAVPCYIELPKPPDGKTLDIETVNVVATINGKEETLTYSKDCAQGTGWHYDDTSNPTHVQLCKNSCDHVRSDSGGRLGVTFGCKTQGIIN